MIQTIAQFVADSLSLDLGSVSVEVPANETHGHYSTNIAMRFAKKGGKKPSEMAEEFVAKLKEADKEGMFSKIEVVEPGFINFTLSLSFLQAQLSQAISEGEDFGRVKASNGKEVIVEYSDPNIAKPMHVGHLRGTIIGEAIANIYEFLGYKVTRWNYLGDWGTQFGKLIAAYKRWGEDRRINADPITELVALYIRFHEEVKENPELVEEGRREFKKLEDGDEENLKLWKWFREVSLLKFEQMYEQLEVTFDVVKGEAFFAPAMPRIIQKIRDGIGQESEGALIVDLTAENLPPALIEKGDGGSLYLTRDIANIEFREEEYGVEKIIYVVGNEQSLHFNQLFAIAKRLEITDAELVHVKHGLVLGEDGKKLSTRDGKTIALQELIDTLIERAYEAVSKKSPELSEVERREIARVVGIGALKYNDLKENRNSDIVFNWDEMLNFAGNSAPYLQYTVARLDGILQKAGKRPTPDLATLVLEAEVRLMKKILDFSSVVALCGDTYITSHLATYIHELAKLANFYYESTRILMDTEEARITARVALIAQVKQTLQLGLKLLGVKTLPRI